MPKLPSVNPFSPTFGATPPLLAGRDRILDRFCEALDTGPTHPDYTLLLVGDGGTGKTALLNVLEEQAADRGWAVITASASAEPVAKRITGEALRHLDQADACHAERTSDTEDLASSESCSPCSLLTVLGELGAVMADSGKGLLVTVDELHAVDRDDVRNIEAAIQIITRRRQMPVAFVAAALPVVEDTHLDDSHATFLERCSRFRLGPLDPDETRRALREPIIKCGSAIDDDALDAAADVTRGHPYMVQLVGFHSWQMREDPGTPISVTHASAGALEAEAAMVDQIARPIWKRLSPMDRRFLVAMLPGNPDSSLADVATRLGRSVQYARVYRRRLVAAGAISPSENGGVRFLHHAVRVRAEAAQRQQ